MQETFTVRVQSATSLTTNNLKASNGDIVSVSATPGRANSYDVAAKSRTNKGVMTLTTLAGAGVLANTITVDVDVTDAEVSCAAAALHCSFVQSAFDCLLGHNVLQAGVAGGLSAIVLLLHCNVACIACASVAWYML